MFSADAPEDDEFDAFGEDEREAVFRLVAWLTTRTGSPSCDESEHLEDLRDNLELGGLDVDEVLSEVRALDRPDKLARDIQSEECRELTIRALLALAWLGSEYDARHRAGIRRVARAMECPEGTVARLEGEVLDALEELEVDEFECEDEWDAARCAKVGAVAVGGLGLGVVTGGLAAPAIGGAVGSAMGLSAHDWSQICNPKSVQSPITVLRPPVSDQLPLLNPRITC